LPLPDEKLPDMCTEKIVPVIIEKYTRSGNVFVDRVSPLIYDIADLYKEDDTFSYLSYGNRVRLPTLWLTDIINIYTIALYLFHKPVLLLPVRIRLTISWYFIFFP